MSTDWHEKYPGYFERHFDYLELLFDQMTRLDLDSGRENWTITSAICLKVPLATDFVESLRQAWTTLRYEQPNVATNFDRDKAIRTYKVASETELREWLEETFRVEAGLAFQDVLANPTPVKRPVIYVFPHTREILFRCPHLTIDGMGTVGFWNDLLSILANPRQVEFGDESKNLAPVLLNAANVPRTMAQHVEIAKQDIECLFSNLPTMGLSYSQAKSPGATETHTTIFSNSETEQLVKSAKERELTPTHVLKAALVLATQKLSVSPEARHFGATVAFDVRRFCSAQAQKYNVSLYLAAWTFIVEPRGFLDTALAVKDFYLKVGNDVERLPALRPWGDMLKSALNPEFIKGTSENGPSEQPFDASADKTPRRIEEYKDAVSPVLSPTAKPALNSLGVIERKVKRKYGEIEVENFLISVDTLTPHVTMYIFTWRDELRMSTCYNTAFHTQETIANLHQEMIQVLNEELGLAKANYE